MVEAVTSHWSQIISFKLNVSNIDVLLSRMTAVTESIGFITVAWSRFAINSGFLNEWDRCECRNLKIVYVTSFLFWYKLKDLQCFHRIRQA